jgi:hypothetical protein
MFVLSGVMLTLVLAALSGLSGSAQDSVPATVTALQTTVAGLSTTVAGQATQISDLQTAVAGEPGTPVASPTELPDPQTLEIIITFRTDPENVESDGLGTECAGSGRFADFSPDADIAIYDLDEEKLVEATLVGSELIHEGVIFHECEMRFVIEEIPYQNAYIIGITNRSALTHDYAELEEMGWTLDLHYGG